MNDSARLEVCAGERVSRKILARYRAEDRTVFRLRARSLAMSLCRLARLGLVLAVACAAFSARADARIEPGMGSFVVPFLAAGSMREITVWYYRPAASQPDSPVVFVMHGTQRTAQNYRKYWVPLAEARNFLLLVPEFSREQFPRDYNLARLTAADGSVIAPAQWPYAAIERIFDAVRADNGLSARTYDIYGHSAGGQFVHRLALLIPHARYRVAVVANPGWYTMPDFAVRYPYGLAASPVTREQLARTLQRRIVVLLGDRDIDPNHRDLRRTPAANAQGEHRVARGNNFYNQAKRMASELGVPFGWELHSAPGVAHSNARMAPHAAPFVGARD